MITSDTVRHWIKQHIASYGMRVRLPYWFVRGAMNAVDVSSRPFETVRRRSLGQRRIKSSSWAQTIPRKKGFARLPAGSVPEIEYLLEAGREIYRRRAHEIAPITGNNPFQSLLRPEDLREFPAFTEATLSPAILDSAIGYFGTIPRLMYMGLWVTRPNLRDKLFSSQLYHLDQPQSRLLSLFVNIFDVSDDNGPFRLLPADVSNEVCRATNYNWVETFGDGRLSDEQVFAHCPAAAQVALGGAAGNAGFVDTSKCLHYGSRCRAGERVMFVLRFMPAYRTGFNYDPMFRDAPVGDDLVRSLVMPSAVMRRLQSRDKSRIQ